MTGNPKTLERGRKRRLALASEVKKKSLLGWELGTKLLIAKRPNPGREKRGSEVFYEKGGQRTKGRKTWRSGPIRSVKGKETASRPRQKLRMRL